MDLGLANPNQDYHRPHLLGEVDEAHDVPLEALDLQVVAADLGVGRGTEACERRLDRLRVVGGRAGAALRGEPLEVRGVEEEVALGEHLVRVRVRVRIRVRVRVRFRVRVRVRVRSPWERTLWWKRRVGFQARPLRVLTSTCPSPAPRNSACFSSATWLGLGLG